MVGLTNPNGSGPAHQKMGDQLISKCKICDEAIYAGQDRGWARGSYLKPVEAEWEVRVVGLVHIKCAKEHPGIKIIGDPVTGGDVKRGKGTSRAYGN